MNKTLLVSQAAILFVIMLAVSVKPGKAAGTFNQRVDDELPLGTPSLFLPADKSTLLPVEYLQLEWNFVSGSDGEVIYYDLYFGDSPTPPLYRENINDGWVSDDGLEFALKEEPNSSSYLFYLNTLTSLQYQTTYYWKVVAKNSQGESKSSDTFSFTTTRQNTLPTPPVVISPLNNATGVSQNVTLQWAASTDADGDAVTYDLYFGKSKTMPQSQPLIQSGLTTNSYTIPYDLDDQETYYWKVYAIDGYNEEAVSSDGTYNTSKFTVVNYIADAPVAGVLLTPANENLERYLSG
ncbi:MAG TPA: fibronectin type III domain-containing protein [Bacteroidales bacterium]|nr:fibronectin type III domain-containing protein [Bacteroidales bacterium]